MCSLSNDCSQIMAAGSCRRPTDSGMMIADQESSNQGCPVCAGLNIVEGGRAPLQHGGNHRNLVDLQVPFYHGYHEDAPQAEVHARELQEGGNFPAPKIPTFSVFSALYDSVLGEVCFVTTSQRNHTDTRIVLSMARAAGVRHVFSAKSPHLFSVPSAV